jgi:hypothetical protein
MLCHVVLPTTLQSPHHVLLQAAARLNADGHIDLAADVHQLAKRWTPTEYNETIGNADQPRVVLPPLQHHAAPAQPVGMGPQHPLCDV